MQKLRYEILFWQSFSLQQANLEEVDHPIDVDYSLLNADLELLDKKSDEFKVTLLLA